jgi:hypothetical protein
MLVFLWFAAVFSALAAPLNVATLPLSAPPHMEPIQRSETLVSARQDPANLSSSGHVVL